MADDIEPAKAPEKAPNYFDRFDGEADAGDPGLMERVRLNAMDSFYRGTIAGATLLRLKANRVADPEGTAEADKIAMASAGELDVPAYDPKQEKEDFESIIADLARHDAMKGFSTTLEGAAALTGQIGGSLPTPENLLSLPLKGATVLGRVAWGALQGAAINWATDPIVQNISQGVTQKEFDWMRFALAGPLGAVVGGGLVGAGEVVSKTFIRKKFSDLAAEDPSFKGDIAAEGAKPVSADYVPGIKAQGDDTDAIRVQWNDASPFKSVDELMAAAPANQKTLGDTGREIADALGVEFKDPGVKGRARLEEKVFKEGRLPGAVSDTARGGFMIERPDQADAVIDRLSKKFEILDEGWAETPVGYMDRKVVVRFEDGMMGEIQLWEPNMLRAKEEGGGHKLYEEWRSLPYDDPRRAELAQRMTEIYSAALDVASPEWKAVSGKGGSAGNLEAKASGDNTLPPTPIDASSNRSQAPDLNSQASPGAQANGSPSNVPNLTIADNIESARQRGKPEQPGERDQLTAEIERLRQEANTASDRGDSETVDNLLRQWEYVKARLDEIAPPQAPKPSTPAPIDTPNGITVLRPDELKVDADRFQFKGGGDAQGVTDRLKDVKEWNPVLAGMVIAWEDKAGQRFIVDGHQRAALAKRIAQADPAQDPRLNAIVLREADGVSDVDARVIAAIKNIAEGTGSAVDAAKVLRDRPDLIGKLPPRSDLVRQATALVNLEPEAFRMVINDVVPPHYAAIVGRLVPDDGKMQRALIDLLAKTEPANAVQAEAIVRQGREAGLHSEKQTGLFGEEDVATSLFAERAKVLDRALKTLKRDTKIFSTLVKEQDTITGTGNVLVLDANQRRAQSDAQAVQILQVLANRKGPLSDALNDAARKAKDGKLSDAANDFIAVVRREASNGNLGRGEAGGIRGDLEIAPEGGTSPRVQSEIAAIKGNKPDPRQGDIFGGASASQGDLAQRGADAPIRPKKAQGPLDFGLFGDSAAQTDLVDKARAVQPVEKPAELIDDFWRLAADEPGLERIAERLYEWTSAIDDGLIPATSEAAQKIARVASQFKEHFGYAADDETRAAIKSIAGEIGKVPPLKLDRLETPLSDAQLWLLGDIPDGFPSLAHLKSVVEKNAAAEGEWHLPGRMAEIREAATAAEKEVAGSAAGARLEDAGFDASERKIISALRRAATVNEAAVTAFQKAIAGEQPRSLEQLAQKRASEKVAEVAAIADASPFVQFMRGKFGEGWTVEKAGKKEYEAAVKQFIDENPAAAGNMVGFVLTQEKPRKGSTGDEKAIFAGERAAFADREKLALAKKMEQELAGGPVTDGHIAARDMIWLRTGWFRGADGKWRFEIPDHKAHLTGAAHTALNQGDVGASVYFNNADRTIQHSNLFKNYSDIRQVEAFIEKGGGYPYQPSGSFTLTEPGSIRVNANTERQATSIMLHELQHAVQQQEGFARGGSSREFQKLAASIQPDQVRAIAYESYMRLAGEVEARAVQARIHLTELERKMIPPYKSEDRPRSQQFVLSADQRVPEQALAGRRDGSTLNMERARPDTGVASNAAGANTSVSTVPNTPSPKDVAIQSLQQQTAALADALSFPLRQGRNKAGTLGTFNVRTGVTRVSEIADFEVVAHEAGHALEAKIGGDLSNLIGQHPHELALLDYDPARGDLSEGFAEWLRRYIGNPAHAAQVAPGFTSEFRRFMDALHPKTLEAIDAASGAYRAYLNAPSVDMAGAVMRSMSETAHGWRGVVKRIKDEGFPTVIRKVMQDAYSALLDNKAPVARAVRDLARLTKEQTGTLVDLKAADNPDVLMRLFERAHQAAVRDMMDGVRGYHSITPEGPSLHDALAKATGSPSAWGKWNADKKSEFSKYLIDRRAVVLWEKFERGDLPNPPVSFSKADAVVAMGERERLNPGFREGSDMVHAWTRQLLKKQFDGGLIDADLFAKLSKEEFYVPFMRDLSDKPLSGGDPAARGGAMDRVADTVKRMKGSSRDIKDPLESLMTQAFLVNRTLAHNDIIKSFVSLAGRAGAEGGRFVEPLTAKESKRYNFDLKDAIERLAKDRGVDADDARVMTSALTDVFGEDPIVGSFFRMEPTGKRGEPIVFYKEGGELRAARFMSGEEGHALYETLTALPKPLTDAWSQMVAMTTTTLRAGITSNPMFALTNYIRDQFAVALLRNDYVPIVSGVKGIAAEFGQKESAILYGYAGGVSGGASIAPVERAIEADVNALAKKGYIVNRVTSLKGAMDLAAFTEAGTRNSVFDTVFQAKKKQGLSDYEAMIEAAYSAQDILDFSRHGSRTEAIRRYIPFINAWAQGLDKAQRTMIEPVVRAARGDQVFASDPAALNNALLSMTKVFGVGGVLGAGWAALHADSEAYQDVSPQIKGTHVVIPFGNKIILWPKPFELGAGFTMGEYAYQKFAKDDPRTAAMFGTAMWDSFTSSNPLTDIPVLRQVFELKSGKSLFTGRDIVPESLQRLRPEQQYTDKTSSLAKTIGQVIGVSPIKVDYAIGSTFGLWGRDIMAMSSGVDPNQPAQSWEDRVFVRRLLKDPARTSDVTTKFWDFMGQTSGKFNQNVATYDTMVKKFQDQGAKDFLNTLPASERAFVIMKSAAKEDGKPAFGADEKRLHPLQRAYDAVTLLNGLRRELTENTFRNFEGGENIKMDPVTRRDLIENVRELAQMEMRNSFVIMKEPGYAGRALLDVSDTMAKIRAASPTVADEIATRYATAKIYKTEIVAKAYPKLRDELIRGGSDADLSQFVEKGDYEFGGEKVRKPQKRRIQIGIQ